MSLPTPGEEYSKLMEYLRKAEESASMIAHLTRDDDKLRAQGWLAIAEMFRNTRIKITQLATARLQ